MDSLTQENLKAHHASINIYWGSIDRKGPDVHILPKLLVYLCVHVNSLHIFIYLKLREIKHTLDSH